MYSARVPKTQLPDKNLVITYYPHSIDFSQRKWDQNYYRIISIDPGIRHFAFRIERRPMHHGPDVKYFHPVTEIMIKIDFKPYLTDEDTGYSRLYAEVNNFLDGYREWYPSVHMVLIEKQMAINYKMVRLSQHVITYFHCVLANSPLLPSIHEVDPKLKTQMLGAPKGLNKPEVKKWAIEHADEILTIRGDEVGKDIIKKVGKKDDLSDVVVQAEAYFLYMNLPITFVSATIVVMENAPVIPSNITLTPSNPNEGVIVINGDDNDGNDDELQLSLPSNLGTLTLQDIINNT